MPYYSYGYGDFLANNVYVILLIPVLLLSLWAQMQVSGSFRRYNAVSNRRRITGAQAAEAVLRQIHNPQGGLPAEISHKKDLSVAVAATLKITILANIKLVFNVLILISHSCICRRSVVH